MIVLRKSEERGYAHHGWLESWHSFSFADYSDAAHMNFASLRVINEDIIQPNGGFGMHPHRDMEIFTYVLGGVLRHRDSMGNGEDICRGEVQMMCAGSGVTHSEFNPSTTQPVHLLQIWITPDSQNLAPNYQQKNFSEQDKRGRWCLLASQNQAENSLPVHQDIRIFAALLNGGEKLSYSSTVQRYLYLHVADGTLNVNGQRLMAGDALMFSDETEVELSQGVEAEVLLFDMR